MNEIHDGGPAFPQKEPLTSDWYGMTLRDYFAAKASDADIREQEMLWRSKLHDDQTTTSLPDNWRAVARYRHADAMLKAREV